MNFADGMQILQGDYTVGHGCRGGHMTHLMPTRFCRRTLSVSVLISHISFHRQRRRCPHPPPNQNPFIRHIRRPRTLAEAKGTFSDRSGILWSPSVVHHRVGNVLTAQDQPDGERCASTSSGSST